MSRVRERGDEIETEGRRGCRSGGKKCSPEGGKEKNTRTKLRRAFRREIRLWCDGMRTIRGVRVDDKLENTMTRWKKKNTPRAVGVSRTFLSRSRGRPTAVRAFDAIGRRRVITRPYNATGTWSADGTGDYRATAPAVTDGDQVKRENLFGREKRRYRRARKGYARMCV